MDESAGGWGIDMQNKLSAEEQRLCYDRLNEVFRSVRSYLDNNFVMDDTKESKNFSDALVGLNALQSLTLEYLKYGASGWASRRYIDEKIQKLKETRPW